MQLLTTADTTSLSYWLNWRAFLCAVWVVTPMVISLYIIWKYEDLSEAEKRESLNDETRLLPEEDVWRPCIRHVHPAWLLALRAFAVCFLLATTVLRVIVWGWRVYFYYTQWTYTLLNIYFGLGLMLSVHGCYLYPKITRKVTTADHVWTDSEQGYYIPLAPGEANLRKAPKALGICCSIFRILYQMNAGAVVLTDSVYWSVIFPFLAIKDYDFNYMTVNLHTTNLVLLICDTALNSMGFPWFRFAYFVQWTGAFVIFQWIFHACVSIWWPYPFLDLSSPLAPLWYLIVALMHIPCYGLYALVVKLKHELLSKWFPVAYLKPK